MGATSPVGLLPSSPGSALFDSLSQLGNGPDRNQTLTEFLRALSTLLWSQRTLFPTLVEKTCELLDLTQTSAEINDFVLPHCSDTGGPGVRGLVPTDRSPTRLARATVKADIYGGAGLGIHHGKPHALGTCLDFTAAICGRNSWQLCP